MFMPVLGRAALTNRFPLLALRAFFGRPFPKRTLFPQNGYQGKRTDAASQRGLFANWQGSITAVTDATGNAIGVNGYDAYGIPNETNIGRFQYTGQIWLPELGLYYYKARIYSPTLGRFLQTDPIGYEDQYNLYAYVGNDPVNNTDPTGECYLCIDTTKLVKQKTSIQEQEKANKINEEIEDFLVGDIQNAINNPSVGSVVQAVVFTACKPCKAGQKARKLYKLSKVKRSGVLNGKLPKINQLRDKDIDDNIDALSTSVKARRAETAKRIKNKQPADKNHDQRTAQEENLLNQLTKRKKDKNLGDQ